MRTGECLLYGLELEDWRHVLRCKNEHMIRKRNELIEKLEILLKQMQTYPVLQDFIMSLVQKWTTDQDILPPQNAESDINELIQTAYQSQTFVGFDKFI